MKLGLLLALSVAALVLNLSEGRIVSKCELRQKLQEVLPLPRKYGRYKDQILALVTCELERRSHLDSSLVTGNAVLPTAAAMRTTQAAEGNRTATEQDIDSTISSAPMTNSTVATGATDMLNGVSGNARRKRDASSEERGNRHGGNKRRGDNKQGKKGRGHDDSEESASNSEESHEVENIGANKPTANPSTTEMSSDVSGNPRLKRGASSKERGNKRHGNKGRGKQGQGNKGQGHDESESNSEESHEMENMEANKPTASPSTTEMSNGVSGNPRFKRDASSKERGNKRHGNKGRGHDESKESDSNSEESHEMENMGANKPTANPSTTEMSNGVSGNARLKRDASSKERGNNRRGNKGQNDKKTGNKGRGHDKSNESEERRQKNKKEKKPSKHSHESSSQEDNVKPNQGPARYFGLFQLSDSYFCDSGNGLSKNLCNKNCTAFVDDDITDDLECFANKGYWRWILDEVSSSCSSQQDTYFDEC